jgi:hypothetical protein
VLLPVLLLSACSGGSETVAEPTAPATTAPAPAPTAAAPTTPEAQTYLTAVQERDAVVDELRGVLADRTLDIAAFTAAGARYAAAVEGFDQALAAATWPADAQPLVDQVRASNVAELKAARLMESALDETSARLATATLREARRRGAANDTLLRSRLGLPAAQ